jgi:uncharacterized cofD-like protein
MRAIRAETLRDDGQPGLRWSATVPRVPSRMPSGRLAARAPRVVALGGGTGLPVLLRGLKASLFPPGRGWIPARDRDRLAAIVTVADDGGSSGRLRRVYQVLPPGDVRNCLIALSDGDPTMAAIFDFRFNGAGEMAGHSLGNLILTALSQLEGGFGPAVERGAEMLGIRGRVLPATLHDVTLQAQLTDGSWVDGESRIATAGRPIRRVRLQPEEARAAGRAPRLIEAADLIVLGPGSLYTSVIPPLLVRDIAAAVARSRARVVLVANLMTEPGETDGYSVADHLLAIRRHAAAVPIHDVLVNGAPIAGERLDPYVPRGAVPVSLDTEAVSAAGCRAVIRDLLGTGPKIRHDPHKLARAVLDVAREVLQ